jgi:cytochrome c peroxidase
MGQLGSGKNGFGVDYGRFNVTHNTDDLYKFRTPPLLDVENTAPYGHSGSVATMRAAVVRHFDPLRDLPLDQMTDHQRVETYKQIAVSAPSVSLLPYLDQDEVGHIVEFMKTLSFRSKN